MERPRTASVSGGRESVRVVRVVHGWLFWGVFASSIASATTRAMLSRTSKSGGRGAKARMVERRRLHIRRLCDPSLSCLLVQVAVCSMRPPCRAPNKTDVSQRGLTSSSDATAPRAPRICSVISSLSSRTTSSASSEAEAKRNKRSPVRESREAGKMGDDQAGPTRRRRDGSAGRRQQYLKMRGKERRKSSSRVVTRECVGWDTIRCDAMSLGLLSASTLLSLSLVSLSPSPFVGGRAREEIYTSKWGKVYTLLSIYQNAKPE